jgi:anthranilate synthase component 1
MRPGFFVVRLSVSEDEVGAALAEKRPCLLATWLPADLETPVGAYLKLQAAFGSPSLLLESIEGGAVRGRYTMLAFRPDVVWMCHDGAVSVARDCDLPNPAFAPDRRPPLDALRAILAESAVPDADGLPPMAAGIFGTFAYDMVRHMERLAGPKPDRLGVPDAMLMRPTLMLIFDHVTDEITVVTPIRPREGVPASAAWRNGVERVNAAIAALRAAVPDDEPGHMAGPLPEPVSNTPDGEYLAMVRQAKEYIAAGDVFQVVLSQRFSAPFGLSAFRLYRALRRVNRPPFLCYLDFGPGRSRPPPRDPGRLRDGVVTIRPLAGTRPRGATEAADADLGARTPRDEKERAEHLMLLDLGRNDVGRVARSAASP